MMSKEGILPAKDRVHDVVVRALEKDGWKVIRQQVKLGIGERRLSVDIYAEKSTDRLAILVEVKGFENIPSPMDYLANSVGQYVLYRVVLDYSENPTPLYMAVPEMAYNG